MTSMSAYLSSPDDKDDAMSELKTWDRDRDIDISVFLKKQAFDCQIRPAELSQRGIALQERLFTPKQRQSEELASFVCPCMLCTEPNPFPLFNDKFLSIPIIGMEVKSVKFSMKLKINVIKGESDWQQAQLVPDFQRQDCINSSHGDGVEINPVLMTLKINFNSCERNWQQIQMYCSL